MRLELDARKLPNETTARFALLMVGAGTVTLALAEALWYSVFLQDANATLQRCLGTSGADLLAQFLCQRDQSHQQVLWVLLVGALVLATALMAALLGSLLRRRRLSPAPFVAPIDTLVVQPVLRRLGLTSATLLYRKDRPTAQARADGVRSPYVEVGPNWMSLSLTDPPRARALLHHEMFHLKARDVFPARLTWWTLPAVLTLAAIYLGTILPFGGAVLAGIFRTVVAAAVVLLGRAAVLRAREFAADNAAVQYEPEAMSRWFIGPEKHRNVVIGFIDVHPSTVGRALNVADPTLTCRLRPTDGVIVGLTASIGGPTLSRLWRTWFQYGDSAYWAELPGWAIIGALLGLWLAVMLIRAVAAGRITGRPVRIAGFSWAVAGSLVVGGLIFNEPFGLPPSVPPLTIVALAGIALVPLGMVALIQWLRFAIEWWFDLRPSARRRAAIYPPVAIGTIVGATLIGTLANLRYSTSLSPEGLDQNYLLLTLNILNLQATSVPAVLLICLAVLTPVVFLMIPPRVGAASPPWLTAHPGPDRRPPVHHWLLTTVIGIAAGALAVGAVQALAAWGPAPTDWYAVNVVVLAGQTLAGATVAAGAVLAATISVAPPVEGALAGGCAALTATAGILIARPPTVLSIDVSTGILVDIAAGGVVGGLLLSALVQRRRAGTASGLPVIIINAVLVVAPFVLVTGAIAWLSSPPSVSEDFTHFGEAFARSADDLNQVGAACDSRVATDDAAEAAARVLEDLDTPSQTPATPEVLAVQREFVASIAACEAGLRAAVDNGTTRIDPAAIESMNEHLTRYNEALAQLPN